MSMYSIKFNATISENLDEFTRQPIREYKQKLSSREYFRIHSNKNLWRVMCYCVWKKSTGYTPGIYADGYIPFAFPFVRSYVS